METRNTGNQTRNSSDNFSPAINSTSSFREYVFALASYRVNLILLTVTLSFGVYGFIANFLILYFKNKKYRRRRHTLQGPSSGSLTYYFINSLALSDLLCCVISLPLFASELFIDFVKSDSICRLVRCITLYFPVVTIVNLLVIGIERYLVIFHPFRHVSRRKAKRVVIGAWLLSALIILFFISFVRLVKHDDTEVSALVCKYDTSNPSRRALFIGSFFILYVLPSFILIFINLRILKRKRDSQSVSNASEVAQRSLSRLKVTRMFVSLIFAFIIPYLAFSIYAILRTVMNLNVSFADDYIVRNVSGLLVFANGSISATIFIYYEKLYLDFLSCFRSRPTRNNRCNKIVPKQAPVNLGIRGRKDTPMAPTKNVGKNKTSSV